MNYLSDEQSGTTAFYPKIKKKISLIVGWVDED